MAETVPGVVPNNGRRLYDSTGSETGTLTNPFKTQSILIDSQISKQVEIEPLGRIASIIPTRLSGTAFSNGTKDTNFWTETVTDSGSVTQSGEIILSTGETADSTARYQSVRKARKVTGYTHEFRMIGRNIQDVTDDCIRRIGCYDDNDGFFFQYDGTVFGVGARKATVDTIVTNGNFNGNDGRTIDAIDTNYTRLVIKYTQKNAYFYVDGVLIHTLSATTTSLTTTQDFKITTEIINENGNTTANSYGVLFATILRFGQLETEKQFKYLGANATTVLKYGAGRLARIVNLDTAGDVLVYDNTAASGDQIAVIDTAKTSSNLEFGIPFNNGLTIVVSGGAKVTVIYE